MENKLLFKVTSKLEAKDFRKFLYLATFKRSPLIIPVIGLIGLIAASTITFVNGPFTVVKFLGLFLSLFLIAYIATCLKVEYRSFVVKKDKNHPIFKDNHNISFFENYIMPAKNKGKNKTKIEYSKLFKVLKTDKYLVIYYNTSVASIVRKEDLDEETWNGLVDFLKNKLDNKFKKVI